MVDLTDDELAELSDDPELAFVQFERTMRIRLPEAEDAESQEQYGDADSYRLEYMNKVLAAARAYSIDELTHWKVPAAGGRIFDEYRQFISNVDHYTIQIRIRHAPCYRKNSVGLDSPTKSKIHHHIRQIRAVIEEAELPDTKRDTLYEKLNRFALEVDRARTGVGAFAAAFIGVCGAIGQGFENLEPARRWLDSIAGLLGTAKDVEDSLRPLLTPPSERRRLEPPRNRSSEIPQEAKEMDSEIPF